MIRREENVTATETLGRFRVKGVEGLDTYLEVLGEDHNGFHLRITSTGIHGMRESCEYISKELFDVCLRTGYIRAERA